MNNLKCNDEKAIQAKHKIESSKTDEHKNTSTLKLMHLETKIEYTN